MKKTDTAQVNKQTDGSPGFLLWRAANLWQREIRKALEPLDLTHTQFLVLSSLVQMSSTAQPITQVALAGETGMDAMTTSTVVRTLQSKGLVVRSDHAGDSRAKLLSLTDQGRTIASQAIKIVDKFDKKFFAALDTKVQKFNQRLLTLLKEEQPKK